MNKQKRRIPQGNTQSRVVIEPLGPISGPLSLAAANACHSSSTGREVHPVGRSRDREAPQIHRTEFGREPVPIHTGRPAIPESSAWERVAGNVRFRRGRAPLSCGQAGTPRSLPTAGQRPGSGRHVRHRAGSTPGKHAHAGYAAHAPCPKTWN